MSNKYTQEIDSEQVDTTCVRAHPKPYESIDWDEFIMKTQIALVAGLLAMSILSGCDPGGEAESLSWGSVPQYSGDDCDDTFAPESAMLDTVEWALDKWSESTGKVLCIADYGIPVIAAEHVFTDGEETCGNTSVAYDSDTGQFMYAAFIEISYGIPTRCPYPDHTVLHELGHAIAHKNKGLPIHTDEYSVMSARVNSTTEINQAAIDLVCATSECPSQ